MTELEFKKKLNENYGYKPNEGWRYVKDQSIIEVGSRLVELDSKKNFTERSNYPICVRIPNNNLEFLWIIKMSRYLGAEEGYRKLVRHNKRMIDSYPKNIEAFNFDRIVIL